MRAVLGFILSIGALVLSHPGYKLKIPNGGLVPNPCSGGGLWTAVGHLIADNHTDAKNLFGQAFKNASHVWTTDLCQLDSDSDGHTNGHELGDPNCTWTEGAAAPTTAHGHPGICEPMTSAACIVVNDAQGLSCGTA